MMFRTVNVLVLLCVCGLTTAGDVGAGLIGAWEFEAGYADTGVEPLYTGVASGDALIMFDLDRFSKVLCVQGNGHVTCAPPSGNDKMNMTGFFTVAAWIKPDTEDVWWAGLLGKGDSAYRTFRHGGGVLGYAQVGTSGGPLAQGGYGMMPAGQWSHFGMTYDGQVVCMYVNGQTVDTKFASGTVWVSSLPFMIGNIKSGYSPSFQGSIDDVAVWNVVLDADAFTALHDQTKTIHDVAEDEVTGAARCNLYIDRIIDLLDLAELAMQWLDEGCVPPPAAPADWRCADADASGRVEAGDLAICTEHWLESGFDDPALFGVMAEIDRLMGVPTLKIDSQWHTIPGYSNYYPNPPYLADFTQAGTDVFDFPSTPSAWPNGLPTVWTGPNTWYYGNVDDYFFRIIANNADAKIIPRLYFLTPQWWLDDAANAGEMELMDDGVTGLSMYYSQYDSNPGILPRSGPFPSLGSQKWREDMAYALEHYLDHVEEAGYNDYVIGYELSGLATEEWYHWSSNRQELAGYSVPTRNAFRDWLRERYNDDVNALRASWSDPSVTFDTAEVPSRAERKDGENSRTFRNPGQHMNVIDFYQFYNEIIPEVMDYLAEVIKRKTNGMKVVGAFYGYMYEFHASPEFGHNALKQFNQCENIDYIYVTSSYLNRALGEADLLRSQAYSVLLHDKLWFPSNDTATVATPEEFRWPELGYTDTIEKNRWMFRRAAGQNVSNGFYHNFFDLHGGYYNHPDLMAEVDYLNDFYDRSKDSDRSRASEILIVSDEFSCNYVSSLDWFNGLLNTQLSMPQLELTQMGAPADHILIDDIALADISRYKLVVFMNCYHLDTAQRALVDSLKGAGRLLVFCYAPGYFNGTASSIANMTATCGMNLSVSGSESFVPLRVNIRYDSHPLAQALYSTGSANRTFGHSASSGKRIWVNDGGATRLGIYSGRSEHAMAVKDMGTWTSVYCATAFMPSAIYRELARYAGVHIYNEQDDTLYANGSYVCLHAGSAGSRTITWPLAVDVYDALSEQLLQSDTTTYTRTYQFGETMIYRYE